MERYFLILSISLEAVFNNKFRSVLTALGIIFGVAAVIAMLAIGNGAKQEILEQIKLVGLNNIIVTPKDNGGAQATDEEDETKAMSKKYSPGLTLHDAENLLASIPTVAKVSPEIIYSTPALRDGKKLSVKLSGVTDEYFTLFNQSLKKGNIFNAKQMELGAPVCIIGPEVVAKLFPKEDPMGKQLKCGTIWLKVIGVLKGVTVSKKAEEIGVNGYNRNVYVPIKTLLLRYKDRSLMGQASLMSGGGGQVIYFGNGMVFSSGGDDSYEGENQLNKIVVQVKESSQLSSTTKAIHKILNRRHQGVDDFEITIPELLLKQEQKTKDIFNIVLGAIAGISLIVGGIGIMNIMLASVMERIREIGVRRAIGATKKDIVFQFLAEATFISISGGLIGILLGVIMAKVISVSTDINTIVSFGSIVLSFGVAASVGIIFGWLPAKKAAEQDPVESLRHD